MGGSWVSPWFQAMLIPARWRVAGVRCRPVSVWHVFALSHAGNAFMVGGDPTMDAVAEVLAYCKHGMQRGRRLLLNPAFRRRETRSIARALRKLPLADVVDAVEEYLGACMRTPEHKERVRKPDEADTSRAVAAPLCWALVARLSNGDPRAVRAAWDMPYAQARCMFDALRDLLGECESLASDEEMERWERMRSNPEVAA